MHNLAIVGFGGMGSHHYKLVNENVKALNVKGVWDIREEPRKKATDLGLKAYESLEELLEDEDIDIVTVATPNNFHKDICIQCLNAGKNVICEKPVTLSCRQLEEIIKVAKANKKVFTIHQNRRWDRDYVTVKEIINSNMIGEPYFIESRVQGSRRAMYGWRGYKENGGGMVYDWGVHLIDQMMMMIDSPVTEVTGHLFNIFTEEVDDNIKILLRFENGVSALCEMSTNCTINLPRWHVSCKNGTAVINDWSCEGKIMSIKENAEMEWTDDIVYTEAGPTRTMAPRPARTMEERPLPEVDTARRYFYENILDVLDNGAELKVKPEEALRVMHVIELVFESNRAGCGIKCRV